MPTVILLDVSLSMSRPVQTSDSSETHTRYSLATTAIKSFLDYLNIHSKLEYVGLMAFSSVYEVVCQFTRDYESIKAKLHTLEEVDRTGLDTVFHGVNQLVLSEWGHQTPIQIIVMTDGSCGMGPAGRARVMSALPLPPAYPARLHVLPVAAPNDPLLATAMPLYQKMVELASNSRDSNSPDLPRGAVYCPDQLTVSGVTAAMTRLCEQQYAEFTCTLRCGQLEARVCWFPRAQPARDDAGLKLHVAPVIHVIGFIATQDLGTPIATSRHIIIPQAQPGGSLERRDSYGAKTTTKEGSSTDVSVTDDDTSDPSKIPNFCVLLHGALKVEGMSAIVQLREGWWGCLSAWCDSARARRSCLLLSCMQPGVHAAPWLGPLDALGVQDATPAGETFPVRASRSYGAGGAAGAAWARPHALLADVQKVLRHARKLPEKTQHFYKELNRLRRAAISLGFVELLGAVSSALERECQRLGAGAPPECALQLGHAAAALRDPRTALDAKRHIQPQITDVHSVQ